MWNKGQHKRTHRKQGRCIGHVFTTNPSQGEQHYLCIFLNHISAAKSYDDLKTSPNQVVHRTFKEAAIAYGLLETDEEWDKCMSKASESFMPKQLCSLFVTILIFGKPAKPVVLLEKYKDIMGEDIVRHLPSQVHMSDEEYRMFVENVVLLRLQKELEGMGTCLERFGLPTPDMENKIRRIPKVIAEEMFQVETQKEIGNLKCQQLNMDQQDAICAVMKAVHDENYPQRMFFLNAPGGYGKTFLIETLLPTVRGLGKIALAVASSEITAELLEGGRTAHS